MVRAKFILKEKTAYAESTAQDLVFKADIEDHSYARYTPSGEIKMRVDNPEALEQFVLGGVYYVTFEPRDTASS